MRAGRVKPVKGLPGSDEIHAAVRQASRFRAAVHASKPRFAGQQPFGRVAHFGVRLDAVYLATAPQKQLRQQAGATADVGDSGLRCQPAIAGQRRGDLGRVRGRQRL